MKCVFVMFLNMFIHALYDFGLTLYNFIVICEPRFYKSSYFLYLSFCYIFGTYFDCMHRNLKVSSLNVSYIPSKTQFLSMLKAYTTFHALCSFCFEFNMKVDKKSCYIEKLNIPPPK